ncbi:MAG: GNAT family N-acetyltransferase [Alphaproteobacteria bacterium]|nr:GNAT family N-acetyltransferase [Alphaproteobacteria bacterium]MCD8526007.1 GNAT family N-acetyltransferase [Alphaproteobacteria bacterium]
MKTPTLETARLILRPVTLEDAPSIQKHFAHWDIIKNLSTAVPWPYPADGARTFLQGTIMPQVESGDTHVWAITLKDKPNEAIGMINFRLKDSGKGNRGFWIAREHQRQGLMSEALDPVHDFIFNMLGVESFTVCNSISNIGSRRVKEKTGAVYMEEVEIPHHTGGNKSEKWLVTKESWLKTLQV